MEAPTSGYMEINIDGAFWEQEKKGAWGFVVRDDRGQVALAGSGSLGLVCDALTTETHGCIAALQAAADWGLQSLILESDSKILVKALQTNEYDRAREGMLFREAKFIMAMNFSSATVIHTPRSCNSLAHSLARIGRSRDPNDPAVWAHPLPDFVKDLLGRDLIDPRIN